MNPLIMATTTSRRRMRVSLTLPDYMVIDLGNEARRRGITVSKLVEGYVEPALYPSNADTLAAIEEARSGAEMEELTHEDIENFEAFVARL